RRTAGDEEGAGAAAPLLPRRRDEAPAAGHRRGRPLRRGAVTQVDPVCQMEIEEADAVGSVEHAGVRYYFCHPSCQERFTANPGEFVGGAPRIAAPAPPGATYICPMDPEVRSPEPGACPKCGMALEPDLST